jgi:putative CocE/NonD family hydrolase
MKGDEMTESGKPVAVEKDLAVAVRDGTLLRADVYRPDSTGRFPTLLSRTPYDKTRDVENYHRLAERGYVVVVQDVRGRYASDGEFKPGFYSSDHYDAEDGYDSVEWAASLPWSSGRVGTIGGSYVGWTQWELAHTRPPHLVAMMPQAIAANLLDREMSGVLRLGRVLWWSINTLSPDQRVRGDAPGGPRTTDEAERLWTARDRSKWLWYLPLSEIPEEAMFGIGPHWRHWLKNHATDNFGFLEKHKTVAAPALITTGWYDQQIGAVKHFTGMRSNAATEIARTQTRLVIGPWTHAAYSLDGKVGDVDFGPEATTDFFEMADQWFSYWLKGETNGIDEWPAVRLFVMGANTWRTADDWPIPGTAYRELHLAGDGALTWDRPADEPPDQYVYDPRDPVMTLYSPGGQQEPHDLRALEGRADVLVFTTEPLQTPVEVIGPITMRLWAASSAQDTDFVVRLADVRPDGFTMELSHGIVRAKYRESFERPTLIERDKPYEYTIQLNPTANLFRPGHRIRVEVTSSDFPNFDRNHNTGGDDYSESTLQTARQTIFHDGARPSRIILPVVT